MQSGGQPGAPAAVMVARPGDGLGKARATVAADVALGYARRTVLYLRGVAIGTGGDALAHAPSPPTGTESPQRAHVVVAGWFIAKHSGHGHAGTFICGAPHQ